MAGLLVFHYPFLGGSSSVIFSVLFHASEVHKALHVQWSPDISHKNVRIKQNVRIIHTSKLIGKHTNVGITIVRIIRHVRISEGQLIRVILYLH